MAKKVILDPNFRRMAEIFHPDDLARLHACCDVVWGRDELMPEGMFEQHRADAFAVVTTRWRYGEVSQCPKLRAILEVGGRHPSPAAVDYDACRAKGIRVLSCAPAFGPMVAEMALGLAIDAAREITAGHEAFRVGEEKYLWPGNVGTFTLYGETVGFIGFGGLAQCLKPLIEPFGCRLVAYDPWRTEAYLKDQGVEPLPLYELLSQARVIFVLAIPSVENKAQIDRTMLELIRPDAVFVLMSRAHVVDFDALTELLHAGRFRAAIDVFPEEPMPADHPIRSAPNVVLSAHRAGSIEPSAGERAGPAPRKRGDSNLIGRMVVDDLEAIAQGLPPWHMQPAEPEIVARLP